MEGTRMGVLLLALGLRMIERSISTNTSFALAALGGAVHPFRPFVLHEPIWQNGRAVYIFGDYAHCGDCDGCRLFHPGRSPRQGGTSWQLICALFL